MKKWLKYLLIASNVLLFGCNQAQNSITNSNGSNTNVPSLNSSSSQLLFDSNLIGKWYIHSTNMGVLTINTEFEIFNDYSLIIQNVHFSLIGLYENFEGAYQFRSDRGITTFIVSYDGEGVDWGFSDTAGQSDFGYAMRNPLQGELTYDYVGKNWPMEMINEWLELDGSIPSYPNKMYYLLNGDSQIYNAKYSMIDIFDVPNDGLETYLNILLTNDFIQDEELNGFKIFHDSNKKYKLRIIYFSNDNNLSIFVYDFNVNFE